MSRAAYRKHANPILVNRLDFDRSPAPILLSARQAAAMLDVCYDTMTARMRANCYKDRYCFPNFSRTSFLLSPCPRRTSMSQSLLSIIIRRS